MGGVIKIAVKGENITVGSCYKEKDAYDKNGADDKHKNEVKVKKFNRKPHTTSRPKPKQKPIKDKTTVKPKMAEMTMRQNNDTQTTQKPTSKRITSTKKPIQRRTTPKRKVSRKTTKRRTTA